MDPVGITNLALLKIGAQAQVSSINPSDGSTEGNAASILYQPTMDNLMRAAHWNFTRKQDSGTLVAASWDTSENATQTLPQPPQPWLYAYSYPAQCLKVRYLLPTFDTATMSGTTVPISTFNGASLPWMPFNPIVGAIPYVESLITDASGNLVKVVLTNLENAQIVYTLRVTDCNLWDVSFVEAASSALGCWLVNAIARNAQLSAEQRGIASALINQARVSDGNEGMTTVDHVPDFISIRGSGCFGGIGPYYGGYDNMVWPGGI